MSWAPGAWAPNAWGGTVWALQDEGEPVVLVVTSIVLTRGTANVAIGGATTLTATVLDQFDNPMAGETVSFTVESGTSGDLSDPTAVSNALGRAQVLVIIDATGESTFKAAIDAVESSVVSITGVEAGDVLQYRNIQLGVYL